MKNIESNNRMSAGNKMDPDHNTHYKANDTTEASVEDLVESIREKIQCTLEKKAHNKGSKHH